VFLIHANRKPSDQTVIGFRPGVEPVSEKDVRWLCELERLVLNGG